MKLARIIRSNSDWLVVAALVVLIGIISILAFFYPKESEVKVDSEAKQYGSYEQTSELYRIIPPDPKYPPPAKEQRSFYKSYLEKDIYYNIEKLEINTSRDPMLGPHIFRVNLYNSANKIVKPADDYLRAVTIQCIAQDDGSYRTLDVKTAPFSLNAYETKHITITTDPRCLYLGTADSRYFWRIY